MAPLPAAWAMQPNMIPIFAISFWQFPGYLDNPVTGGRELDLHKRDFDPAPSASSEKATGSFTSTISRMASGNGMIRRIGRRSNVTNCSTTFWHGST